MLKGLFKRQPIAIDDNRVFFRTIKSAGFDSAKAARLRLEKWNRLRFYEKALSEKDIKEFKFLYEGSSELLVHAFEHFSESKQTDFQTYCLNPSYYNNYLAKNGNL